MEMRRKDRQLTKEEAEELLYHAEYGVLSTVGADGMPYGVPISFAYEDGCIYMHCSSENGHKKENIAFNAKASFAATDGVVRQASKFGTLYRSAIAFGKIEIVSDKTEKQKGIEAILKKYSSDYMENGFKMIERLFEEFDIIKLTIDTLSGKGKKN